MVAIDNRDVVADPSKVQELPNVAVVAALDIDRDLYDAFYFAGRGTLFGLTAENRFIEIPGAHKLAESLCCGKPLVLVTKQPKVIADAMLTQAGMSHLFQDRIAGPGKSYSTAAELVGATNHRSVVFEDSIIGAAMAIGRSVGRGTEDLIVVGQPDADPKSFESIVKEIQEQADERDSEGKSFRGRLRIVQSWEHVTVHHSSPMSDHGLNAELPANMRAMPVNQQ